MAYYPYTQRVGREGGTIAIDDGFRLIIPEGALSDVTEITIDKPATLPRVNNIRTLSYARKLTPERLQFLKSCTLEIPYDKDSVSDMRKVHIYVGDDISWTDPLEWHPLPQLFDDNGDFLGGTIDNFDHIYAFVGEDLS